MKSVHAYFSNPDSALAYISAMPESTPETDSPDTPAQTDAPPPAAADLPQELQACIGKMRETIGTALSEAELLAVLKKNLRPLRDWPRWSEPAREAYAHLLVAQVLHAKAVSACIEEGLALEESELEQYQRSLQSLQARH